MSLLKAPLADGVMRLAKAGVGAKMDGCGNAPCRQLRALDAIISREPLAYFGADLD